MKQAIKLLLIGGALLIPAPLSSAEQRGSMEVAIQYDRTAPIETTYSRARAAARKACQINGRVAPMKRYLEETCVAPIVAQFVLQTENQDLIAHYEAKMGEPPVAVPFVAD